MFFSFYCKTLTEATRSFRASLKNGEIQETSGYGRRKHEPKVFGFVVSSIKHNQGV